MVWNYRELITCMYRSNVRASHYKINPPLLVTCTDWTDFTDRLWFHPRVARPSVIAPSLWPLRESGTLFRWPSRRCSHCPCSSDISSRLCCLPTATTLIAIYCSRRDPIFWFVKFCTVS